MTKAHDGFNGLSGIQKHSAGNHFPATSYQVGSGDTCYHVIQHPCGTKRVTNIGEWVEEVLASFKAADDIISNSGLDFNVVSERTAFELALLGLSKSKDHYSYCGSEFVVDYHR